MATIPEALALAFEHHQAGRSRAAEQIYRQILAVQPHEVDTLHLLGVLMHQLGKRDEAAGLIEQAIALKGNDPAFHNNLGEVYRALGRMAEAADCYQKTLEMNPDSAEAHYNLGAVLTIMGKLEDAATCFRRALELKSDYVEAHINLGAALKDLGKLQGAVASYRHALSLRTDSVEANYNLGNALRDQGNLDDAIIHYRCALELKPNFAEAHNNLGIAFKDQGKLDEAVACHRRALELKPDYFDAQSNLRVALMLQGQFKEVISLCEERLRLEPNCPGTHLTLGLACLHIGDLKRGWQEYEWRWHCAGFHHPPFAQPRWDGSPLEGRTILLWADEALGDTIHFVRYAQLVKERGGIVLLEAPAPLLPLLARCPGIDRLFPLGEQRPDFDVQAPLYSLPALFSTTLESIPAQVPYLTAEPARLEKWGAELRAEPAFKIGIRWQGSPQHQWDHFRSVPLQHFAPLARLPGVRLYSLQKGFGSEQLAAVSDWGIVDLGLRLDEQGAFLDTAALMQHLDLVVSCDTSVLHVAGALAVPVWGALSQTNDWRWMPHREDSPWYPTLRLFRQRRLNEWGDVFARIAEEVQELKLQARRDVHCP